MKKEEREESQAPGPYFGTFFEEEESQRWAEQADNACSGTEGLEAPALRLHRVILDIGVHI